MKLRKFLNDHDRLITFCGALLVFFTFITKDILHDKWKDLADVIDATDSTLLVRSDIEDATNMLAARVRLVAEAVDFIFKQEVGKIKTPSKFAKIFRAIDSDPSPDLADDNHSEVALVIWHSRRLLTAIDPLLETMQSDTRQTEAKQLNADIDSYRDKCFLDDPSAEVDFMFCEKERTDLPQRVTAFISKTRTDANRLNLCYKRLATLFGWVSVFTYTLGWGLGLLGSLYGGKDKIPEASSA